MGAITDVKVADKEVTLVEFGTHQIGIGYSSDLCGIRLTPMKDAWAGLTKEDWLDGISLSKAQEDNDSPQVLMYFHTKESLLTFQMAVDALVASYGEQSTY